MLFRNSVWGIISTREESLNSDLDINEKNPPNPPKYIEYQLWG